MKSEGPTASTAAGGNQLELQIGRALVNIWFDADGIHFGPRDGHSAEGLLPWDVAMAMSLIPDSVRRPINTSAA